MITDILELIKLAREILEKKRVLDKEYFNNFVEPVWVMFQKIHADYKNSFLSYSELFADSGGDLNLLIKKIHQDIIYLGDVRHELYLLASILRASKLSKMNIPIEEFVEEISNYFDSIRKIDLNQQEKDTHFLFYEDKDRRMYSRLDEINKYEKETKFGKIMYGVVPKDNRLRYGVMIHILRNKHELDVEELNKFFNIIVTELQRRYSNVSDAYYEIRAKYLSGI